MRGVRIKAIVHRLCALGGCLLFSTSAPAFAKEVHVYRVSFGSAGSGAGQFNVPRGIAVDDVTHDPYVVDSGNNRVEKFDANGSTILGEFTGTGAPTGTFSGPTEIAVDNSGSALDPSDQDVYVVDGEHGAIDKFDPNGTYIGQLTGTPEGPFEPERTAGPRVIEGVAVDRSGTLWVILATGPIYAFSDALKNTLVRSVSRVLSRSWGGLAIDSEDSLYFRDGVKEAAKVDEFGNTVLNPFSHDREVTGIAVDPVAEEVYLDNGDAIEAFDLNAVPIERFGSGHLSFSRGVAVDASNGTVYAADAAADNVSIFEAIVLPDVNITAPSEQSPRTVTLNGTVNPQGRPVTSCVFEYGSTSAYGQSVPCSPAGIGTGSTPVAVSAHLSGLTPESEYHYRLVAENSAGVPSATPDHSFFTGPVLGGQYSSDVTASSATLHDSIDPNGADTRYYIEYGPTAAYGFYAPVASPRVDIGSAVGAQGVGAHLQGLEAGTVYHYRFVALQDGEAFAEGDGSFTTQSAHGPEGLPDGRAWELVSPANKRGAVLELTERGGQVQAADDGGGITYIGEGASIEQNPAGNTIYSQILSRRGGAGWRSVDLTLPGRLPEDEEPAENLFKNHFTYRLFSPDLSFAAVEPEPFGTPVLSPLVSERTLFLRNNLDGTFMPLVSPANVPEATKIEEESFVGADPNEWEMHFLAATSDLSHVVLKTPKALTADAIDEETVESTRQEHRIENIQSNLYEWSAEGLQLVNILPNNEVAHGRYPKAPLVRLAGVTDDGGLASGGAPRAVSDDGRRIAWMWGEPYTPQQLAGYRGLYVRDMVEGRTVRLGGASAVYQTMNSDGSKIFYTENGDLYVYEWATGAETDLTANHGSGEPDAEVQQEVSDISEDGSYVYFVARGVLAAGAVSGEDNLYMLHDTGSGWVTTFVATLAPQDQRSWYGQFFGAPSLPRVSSRVSPNGRYLAFMSQRSLTGYDNKDVVSGVPDEEVFLYDGQEGRLVCASCNPTGARPAGVLDANESKLLVDRIEAWTRGQAREGDPATDHWLAGSLPGWDELMVTDPTTYQPRYLSDSGRLFFDSPDGLAAQDTNGLEDVYEYEATGVGDCVEGAARFSERSQGCVSLLSSGTSSAESAFYDASVSGDDVFLTTTSKLVPEDYDKGYDVYDAHVCTQSVPCVPAPVAPLPCASSDSCKPAQSPQPAIFGPPPSATFNGAGNVSAVPVAKSPPSLKARKLARALKACRKKRGGRRRLCERKARRRYPLRRANAHGSAIVHGRRG